MFKLVANPTFKHTVPVMVPVDGGHKEQTLSVTFRALSGDEVAKFDLDTKDGSDQFLQAVVAKIDDVEDEQGKAVEYNDELRDRLFAQPYVRTAIFNSYRAAMGKAKTGN
jgi:hypothetical protein